MNVNSERTRVAVLVGIATVAFIALVMFARRPIFLDRQQLCDVTGERVPHQVGRTVFLVEPLRGRPDRNGARIGAQRQPDHARCSTPELSPVDLGPYASGARHPRVSHRVSLPVFKRSRPSSSLSPAYVSIREVSIGRAL